MKRLTIVSTVILSLFCSSISLAQNPIIRNQFTADPTARVFNGRLYLFPSHDIISPVQPERKWFSMADYHVFSTDNMTDWTDHGVILSQEQVPWGNPKAYAMWAPDCIEVESGKVKVESGMLNVEGGKLNDESGENSSKRYYFYFPDAPKEGRGFGVGVAIADKPEGPYTPQPENIKGLMGIDPCVLQASNGDNVIFWGAGGIVQAKLKPNLLELDGEPERLTYLPKAGLQEGPFAFERNGKYYLTYPWVRKEGGTEALVYCMSDSPMGPWEYKGVIMKEHADGCWTNHHSIVEFKGQWYLFYHHNDYSPKFDKNRSVCVDSLTFNADGTIQEVTPTLRGVGITQSDSHIQMDRYSHIGGGARIEYNDTTNYFMGWKTVLPKGGWVSYGNVNIPDNLLKPETSNLKPQTWLCMPGFFGRSQIVDIKDTELSLKINKQPNGLYELELMNNGDKTAEVDWISLSNRKPLVPATSGGLSSGTYRNLFVEAGYQPEAVEAKLHEVFNDVFVNKKTKCYFETSISSPQVGKVEAAYISDIKNNDVRTEGMSYGMMIAVQFDRKDIFDRLWRWAKTYMQIQDGPMKGYFRWSCKQDGTANAQGPASDGELYFITSLIFASNLWGNSGEINYLKEAQNILDAIQPKEGPLPTSPRGGDANAQQQKRTIALIDPKADLISFVPGVPFTDPSYHLPAFYEVWARYAEDGRANYWRECARKSREYLHKSINAVTGLNPDYNNFDGSLMHGRGVIGDAFRYDSWRVPMNIALDYSWSRADKDWQQHYGETIQNFLYDKGIDTFVDQYNIDGTTPDKILRAGNYPEKLRHSIGLVATSAAASIMCSHQKSYEFIDRLWNAKHEPDADGYFDAYYDGLLRLFAFMHLSGHYRVIEKTPQLEEYFEAPSQPSRGKVTVQSAAPDEEGFIRRWTLRDPISKPNRSNTVFTDSYINEIFPEAIKTPSLRGRAGERLWHCLDSKLYHVKLYRFATCTGQQRYGVIFWAMTTIECDEDMVVRFGIGSNGASKWWLNNTNVALLSGDRRMVRDDLVTQPVTLHKGKNIITGAVINGPGMSDFCFRIMDKDGMKPITNLKVY